MKKEDFKNLKHFKHNEIFNNGQMQFFEDTILKNTAFKSMQLIDDLTDFIGLPCVIHCTYDLDGHASKSYHKRFDKTAIDFSFRKWQNKYADFYDLCMSVNQFFERSDQSVGLGFYPDWNNQGFHLDPRGYTKRWIRLDKIRDKLGIGYTYDDECFKIMKKIYNK